MSPARPWTSTADARCDSCDDAPPGKEGLSVQIERLTFKVPELQFCGVVRMALPSTPRAPLKPAWRLAPPSAPQVHGEGWTASLRPRTRIVAWLSLPIIRSVEYVHSGKPPGKCSRCRKIYKCAILISPARLQARVPITLASSTSLISMQFLTEQFKASLKSSIAGQIAHNINWRAAHSHGARAMRGAPSLQSKQSVRRPAPRE